MTGPVGLGTDLIEVGRIRAVIDRHRDRFLDRCFTKGEQRDAERSGRARSAERYAVRFAAKEAVLKALGTGLARGIAWTDIEIRSDTDGAPSVVLTGRAKSIAEDRGVSAWHCSMTHTAGHAAATVIAVG